MDQESGGKNIWSLSFLSNIDSNLSKHCFQVNTVHPSVWKQVEMEKGGGLIHISIGSPHTKPEHRKEAKMMSLFAVWLPLVT